jgi:hypothetical protein
MNTFYTLVVEEVSALCILQTPMKKTKLLIGDAGATFSNAVGTSLCYNLLHIRLSNVPQ